MIYPADCVTNYHTFIALTRGLITAVIVSIDTTFLGQVFLYEHTIWRFVQSPGTESGHRHADRRCLFNGRCCTTDRWNAAGSGAGVNQRIGSTPLPQSQHLQQYGAI